MRSESSRNTRRLSARAALVLLALLLAAFLRPATVRAEIIDRLLAVAAGQIITQADVLGALEFGLVQPAPGGDLVDRSLDLLIERELVLAEVERYQPPEPTRQEVADRLAAIRARFPTQEAYTTALATYGYAEQRLSDFARNDLRILRYLEQRFPSTILPTDEEVAAYYGTHTAEFATGGRVPALAEVREQVRRRLAAERRQALMADWVDGLKRRGDVIKLYLGVSGSG
jgi:hypothetical protein